MSQSEHLGIVGSGAIACGLARAAAEHLAGPVTLLARSAESAERVATRLGGLDNGPAEITITTDPAALAPATYVVEAIVEEIGAKAAAIRALPLAEDAVVASTTSSLSVNDLAAACGRPNRFAALHVFNPVHRMTLVELAFPAQASEATRDRTRALCSALGKTAVEVPDIPGFVVNRLLFPYLFSAVELMEQTGMSAEAIDTCMTLGTGHPMGPLALLDFVGLDVAGAIGDSLGVPVPARLRALVAEGALGRKSGRGFHEADG